MMVGSKEGVASARLRLLSSDHHVAPTNTSAARGLRRLQQGASAWKVAAALRTLQDGLALREPSARPSA